MDTQNYLSGSFLQSHEYVISTLFSILVLDGLLLASSLIIQMINRLCL